MTTSISTYPVNNPLFIYRYIYNGGIGKIVNIQRIVCDTTADFTFIINGEQDEVPNIGIFSEFQVLLTHSKGFIQHYKKDGDE